MLFQHVPASYFVHPLSSTASLSLSELSPVANCLQNFACGAVKFDDHIIVML